MYGRMQSSLHVSLDDYNVGALLFSPLPGDNPSKNPLNLSCTAPQPPLLHGFPLINRLQSLRKWCRTRACKKKAAQKMADLEEEDDVAGPEVDADGPSTVKALPSLRSTAKPMRRWAANVGVSVVVVGLARREGEKVAVHATNTLHSSGHNKAEEVLSEARNNAL